MTKGWRRRAISSDVRERARRSSSTRIVISEQYVDAAAAEGLRITQVTETHIHADFVSGARELAHLTGAQLLLSSEGGLDWQYAYAAEAGARLLKDGDRIAVGNIDLEVMHSPGHTPEHISFIVTDRPAAAGPWGILTGDFVFVGDVGRPDLLERAAGFAGTMETAARTLFRSLARFRALPDHLQVWPGHGAGSACGKALGAIPSSTVGYEKIGNWGVAEIDEEAFVRGVLDGQPEPPRYFAEMKRINKHGPRLLDRTDGAFPVVQRLPRNGDRAAARTARGHRRRAARRRVRGGTCAWYSQHSARWRVHDLGGVAVALRPRGLPARE